MPPKRCTVCGLIHTTYTGSRIACTSHTKSQTIDGVTTYYPKNERPPCRKAPVQGLRQCASHGGNNKTNRAAGWVRVVEQRAAHIMRTYGIPVETTATEALLDEVKYTAGAVAWLRDKVAKLDEADLIWGKTKTTEQDVAIPGIGLDKASGTTEEAKPHIYRQMLLEERKHLVDVCKAAISAGIEERRVRLAESQGALVAEAIRQILGDLNLTPEQAALVNTIVPARLRLLTGGAA